MGEGNGVFLPERLESEEASSNHHGKVAAVRDHCARTGLLGIIASLRGVRFSKTQLFTRGSAVGFRPRQKRGNFCARQLPAQLHPEAPPREWIGGHSFRVWGLKTTQKRRAKQKKRHRI